MTPDFHLQILLFDQYPVNDHTSLYHFIATLTLLHSTLYLSTQHIKAKLLVIAKKTYCTVHI